MTTGTELLRLAENHGGEFVHDDLRAGMELLKDTHAEAYEKLREASQVDDAGGSKAGKGKKKTAEDKGMKPIE